MEKHKVFYAESLEIQKAKKGNKNILGVSVSYRLNSHFIFHNVLPVAAGILQSVWRRSNLHHLTRVLIVLGGYNMVNIQTLTYIWFIFIFFYI